MARRSQPPKSVIKPLPTSDQQRAALERLAETVVYEGHPHHKANPLDYKLTPPASPRDTKTLCDEVGQIRKAQAQAHLERGLIEGLVSGEWNGEDWPARIWSVHDQGRVFEAKQHGPGRYHGFPLDETDPFAKLVLQHRSAVLGRDDGP